MYHIPLAGKYSFRQASEILKNHTGVGGFTEEELLRQVENGNLVLRAEIFDAYLISHFSPGYVVLDPEENADVLCILRDVIGRKYKKSVDVISLNYSDETFSIFVEETFFSCSFNLPITLLRGSFIILAGDESPEYQLKCLASNKILLNTYFAAEDLYRFIDSCDFKSDFSTLLGIELDTADGNKGLSDHLVHGVLVSEKENGEIEDAAEAILNGKLTDVLHQNSSSTLRILLEANRVHWSNVDPEESDTFPSKKVVVAWFKDNGITYDGIADYMDTILRNGRNPPGGRPKKNG